MATRTTTKTPPAKTTTRRKSTAKLAVVPTPLLSTGGRVQVHAAINGLPIEVLRCRANQHNWDPFDAEIQHAEDGATTLLEVQLCPRCGTYKHRSLTVYGKIVRSWYDYPKDYLLDGLGRLESAERDMIRLATFNHALAAKIIKASKSS